MRSSKVTDLCWFQSRTFTVLNLRHVNKTSGSFQICLVLHSAFHHIFAHWANIFHVELLKCAFVLQACVLQMCLLSLGLLFKSTFCRSLMPGTCSAQSISLHGPPAPSCWVLIHPHRKMDSICLVSPVSVHRAKTPHGQDAEIFLLSFKTVVSVSPPSNTLPPSHICSLLSWLTSFSNSLLCLL